MEIPKIVIPEIPVIHIPTTNKSLNIVLPSIEMAGCTKTHRDVSVKNTQIISDDLNGAYYSCPAGHIIPSYIPIKTVLIIRLTGGMYCSWKGTGS